MNPRRGPGKVAMENDIIPGDIILSERGIGQGLYFILGEEPHEDPEHYVRIIIVAKNGQVFRYPHPRGRVDNYPFVMHGKYVDWSE